MRHLSLLLSALLFSAFAQATSTANITTASCSGSQSFDLSKGALLSCDGDFSLIGGSIDSDISITISAAGSLFLDDLSLVAPLVQLKTITGVLTLADGVSINGFNATRFDIGTISSPGITLPPRGDIDLNAGGQIVLNPGGDVTLVSSVPEPAMVWSLLCGGLLLAFRRKDPD
jgi:hypothetical protein